MDGAPSSPPDLNRRPQYEGTATAAGALTAPSVHPVAQLLCLSIRPTQASNVSPGVIPTAISPLRITISTIITPIPAVSPNHKTETFTTSVAPAISRHAFTPPPIFTATTHFALICPFPDTTVQTPSTSDPSPSSQYPHSPSSPHAIRSTLPLKGRISIGVSCSIVLVLIAAAAATYLCCKHRRAVEEEREDGLEQRTIWVTRTFKVENVPGDEIDRQMPAALQGGNAASVSRTATVSAEGASRPRDEMEIEAQEAASGGRSK